jgi:homospermidine synthase
MNNWRLPEKYRVAAAEITAGADELGALILGPNQTGWWYGSRLDIDQTREIFPDTNATALQVAAGTLAASKWMLDNDSLGYRESEDLPFDIILDYARPYLGTLISVPTDWNPLREARRLYEEPFMDLESPWQFNNFLVHAGFRGR